MSFLTSLLIISDSLTDDPPVDPVLLFFSLSWIGLPLQSVLFQSSVIVMSLGGLGFLTLGGNELLYFFPSYIASAVPVSTFKWRMLSLSS